MLPLLLTLALVLVLGAAEEKNEKYDPCVTCGKLTERFESMVEKTSKAAFDGGSVEWEKKYRKSETRFIEIIEGLCHQKDHGCLALVEEAEDDIETYWTQYSQTTTFFEYICIESLKECCPKGRYGKKCLECPGGADKPCNNRGECAGHGMRSGNGTCSCYVGYKGLACESCQKGYFVYGSHTTTETICAKCDDACRDCTGPGPSNCNTCNKGYELRDKTCEDIDECAQAAKENRRMCLTGTWCNNTVGAHACTTCDEACVLFDGCSGPGPRACKTCAKGFKRVEDECQDIDECLKPNACASGHYCVNKPGSRSCLECDEACERSGGCSGSGPSACKACATGYTVVDGVCTNVDECTSNPCESSFTCHDTKGGFTCDCDLPKVKIDGKCVMKEDL